VQQPPPQKKQGMICRFRNPKMGIVCAGGSLCPFAHLDTTIPANLKSWNEATAARGFADKGKSKGKGKGKNKQK